MCSKYLTHPPLTSREKRMLEALKTARAALWTAQNEYAHASPHSPFVVVLEELRALITECHEAQGKPAPITDTYREFDGGDAV